MTETQQAIFDSVVSLKEQLRQAKEKIEDLKRFAYEEAPRIAARMEAEEMAKLKQERDAAIRRAEEAEVELIEQKERARKGRLHAIETGRRLTDALERLEWSDYRTHGLRQCPACFSLKREGMHDKDCFIAKALLRDISEDGTLTTKKA